MRSERHNFGTTAAALTVAACFAALTVGKLLSPDATLTVLREVWHAPPALADAGFVIIIVVEALLIALLVFRPWRLIGLAAAAGFLLVVSVSPARQLIEGSTVGCGCGGAAKVAATRIDHAIALGRNAFLLGLTIFGLWQFAPPRLWTSRMPRHFPLPSFLNRSKSCPSSVPGDAATSAASPS